MPPPSTRDSAAGDEHVCFVFFVFQDTPPATRQAEIVRKEGVRVIMQYENRTRLHMPTVRGVMDDMRRVAYTLGAPFYGYASGGAQIWEWFVAAAAPQFGSNPTLCLP